mmetsp:Transcript_17129/g.47104  ORF Transcript_17129/g.47104 Transcript_17129/m.47104 type:complete len:87 (-) Transcript_17129:564-824(-)
MVHPALMLQLQFSNSTAISIQCLRVRKIVHLTSLLVSVRCVGDIMYHPTKGGDSNEYQYRPPRDAPYWYPYRQVCWYRTNQSNSSG